MNQNLWGPAYWFTLHTITFQYPFHPTENDKLHYKLFFEQLQFLLPCKYCRIHYQQNWKEIPIQLDSRRSLVEWLIKFHNQVNVITGKPIYTLEQVMYQYESYFGHPIPLDPNAENPLLSNSTVHSSNSSSMKPLLGTSTLSSCLHSFSNISIWFYISILIFVLWMLSIYLVLHKRK
jgi:hypothetical protein